MTDIREKAAYILGADKLQMIYIIFAKVLSLFLVINTKNIIIIVLLDKKIKGYHLKAII